MSVEGSVLPLERLEITNPLEKLEYVIPIQRDTKKIVCLLTSYF